ncbi:MAG: GNAT family N-acetyltransferase [Aristaeellaceae bacterium]
MHDVDISLAHPCDIDRWMALVDQVKEAFPGLETQEALAEHRRTVLGFMERNAALCAKCDGKIVGALLFSRENSMLCFLAVDPGFRRRHIAKKLVRHMFTFLDSDRDVTVTTYREGVPEGRAARAFYRHLGFVEGKLTEEFGSPVQEFVFVRSRVDVE